MALGRRIESAAARGAGSLIQLDGTHLPRTEKRRTLTREYVAGVASLATQRCRLGTCGSVAAGVR